MAAQQRKTKEPVSSSPVEMARKYISAIPGAVSGQGGHSATIKVASSLVWGFFLSPEEAFPLLAEWNETCSPPWSDDDLRHKLNDALRQPRKDKDRGWLLNGPHFRTGNGKQRVIPAKPTADVPAKGGAVAKKTVTKPKSWIEKSFSDDPEEAFRLFLENKPGISREALAQAGAEAGYHRSQNVRHRIIAIKTFKPDEPETNCGCLVYRVDGKPFLMGSEEVKIKQLRGSEAGIVGRHAASKLVDGKIKEIIRTAGVSDHLAIQSELIRLGLDDKIISFTGSSGENENPDKYAPLLEPALKDADYFVIADNDETGRKGAEKWARFGFQCGARTRIVELPEEVDGKPIKDVRDFFLAGKTFENLKELMDASPVLTENDFPPPSGTVTSNAGGNGQPPGRVFSPNRTLPTAQAFVEEFYTLDGIPTLRHQNGIFYRWKGNAYREVDEKKLQRQMLHFLHDSFVERNFGGSTTYEPFPAKDTTVNSALHAVGNHVFRESDASVPAWLGPDPAPVANPSMIIFGKTKNLDIETMTTFPASPHWFNYNALNFDYKEDNDPLRQKCPHWDHFMSQLFGDDVDSFATLMSFIGLLLTPITKFQKALFIVGPRRSGKGTIGRVIRKLVGPLNCCSPTTDGLAGQFGLQSLIGKTVAVVSDARFSGPHLSMLTERILNITGEDELSIERKYMTSATLRLPTRFVFISNEIPRMTDASGALASRFIILKLTESFLGKEDLELEKKLEAELPEILNLALAYLKELLEKGRFRQPESARLEVEMMEDLASPIGKFVRERCQRHPDFWAASDDLWEAWKDYCKDEEIHHVGAKATFFRNLNASVQCKRVRKYDTFGKQFWAYKGIKVDGQMF